MLHFGLALLFVVFNFFPATTLEAKKRTPKRHLPPVTHPVVLWARTLSDSTDPEQRKVAAFKLSQYSQPMYQEEVISSLTVCLKDPDTALKVLCTKAMGHAGNQSKMETIRKILLDTYKNDPALRETIVRTFIVRKDDSKEVQNTLLETLKQSTNPNETLVYLSYFQPLGAGISPDPFIDVFNKSTDEKVRRLAIKVLAEHGTGEPALVELLAVCAESKDTPLALNCLAGLQLQSRKDSVRTWSAIEKTIESADPDVLVASLDVINVLPANSNPVITKRLIEITKQTDDGEVLDKAVLALGVAGDHSQSVVDTLYDLMKQKETEESTKINSALVLGKQGDLLQDKPKEVFSQCLSSSTSQSLKTACQLGSQELSTHKAPTKS